MSRSIRWTLLGWYVVILAIVIGGLSATLYARQRGAVRQRIDDELRTHALALAGSLEWEEHDGFELELGGEYDATFGRTSGDAPYYGIWTANGRLLWHSPGLPSDAAPPPEGLRSVGSRREIGAGGPAGARLLVGRGTGQAERTLVAFGRSILLAGLGALAVALGGGFLLVSRVLRPIDRMSEAASRISAANLSARIDVAHTESELGRLASTLNDAFDRLEEAVERQARFTADASHELRTPLAVILTNAEWALREERAPEDYVESLEVCRRAAVRMGRTVEGLLALARADAGAEPVRREPVDLAEIARETAALLGPLARERGIHVTVRADAARVLGDAARLEIVATTLLANALQHGGEGGHVEVRTGGDGEQAFLRVSDDGPGIPPEALLHVFERFYRADRARSGARAEAGSGLGLAIAKQIVEAHAGTIAVESREAERTEFDVRIPVS